MADPKDFSNPFWRRAPRVGGTRGMQKKSAASQPYYGIDMVIGGLGTISARSKTRTQLEFIVKPGNPADQPTLKLTITKSDCLLYMKDKDSEKFKEVDVQYPKGKKSACLNIPDDTPDNDDLTVYWISVDRSNKRFRYGQHLTNVSLTYLNAELDGKKPMDKWMDTLKSTDVTEGEQGDPVDDIVYDPVPVATDIPPLVVTDQQISLEDLENYTYTTFANLPPACQTLYHNVAGPNITLGPPGFRNLGDAINASCNNEKSVCGEMIKKKQENNPFGSDKETYLRITIGNNLGNSPGIPYVMEIWPAGHSSPIHDHGNASAIIKVLYGSIQCSWYDAIQTDRDPIQIGNPVILNKGEVTWLGRKQYQIHKLENTGSTVCVTLQCYQFEQNDMVHDEYFEYIHDKERKEFTPDSDLTYGDLVQKLKEERDNKIAH